MTNPYSAPMVEIVAPPLENEFALATRGQRLCAVFLDGLAIIVALFIFMFVTSFFSIQNMDSSDYFTITTIGAAIFVLANCYLLYTNGQTIGKRMMGIKIVKSNGERAELWRILFLRILVIQVVAFIPVIGWIISLADPLMIFRENHHCLHDDIASTIVILTE